MKRTRGPLILSSLLCLAACQSRAYGPWPKQPMLGTQRSYACVFTSERPDLNGALQDGLWQRAAWTESFVHISGDGRPSTTRTWVKLLWDERFLYMGALVESSNVTADRKVRDAQLSLEDTFAMFIDPTGDGRDLHAIIANANGAVRDVRFTKPPSQGGVEDPSWNCTGLDGGVRVQGTINDASDQDRSWTLEVAIPWSCLGEAAPDPGQVWRANFVRTDVATESEAIAGEQGDQRAWTPSWGSHPMEPQHWGHIQFTRTR